MRRNPRPFPSRVRKRCVAGPGARFTSSPHSRLTSYSFPKIVGLRWQVETIAFLTGSLHYLTSKWRPTPLTGQKIVGKLQSVAYHASPAQDDVCFTPAAAAAAAAVRAPGSWCGCGTSGCCTSCGWTATRAWVAGTGWDACARWVPCWCVSTVWRLVGLLGSFVLVNWDWEGFRWQGILLIFFQVILSRTVRSCLEKTGHSKWTYPICGRTKIKHNKHSIRADISLTTEKCKLITYLSDHACA